MVIIEWLKSCLRHLVLCFWVRFISLLASEVEPLPKLKLGVPCGQETKPKKTTKEKNLKNDNKRKGKDEECREESECRLSSLHDTNDQEDILDPDGPEERIQVAYVEPKLLNEDGAQSSTGEESTLSTDESEEEEPCLRASITVGNVHTFPKRCENSSYLSCHLQKEKLSEDEDKPPQFKQRVGNADLEKSEDDDDNDDSPWIGLGHSTGLTRYSGVQDLLAHSEETPSSVDRRVAGNALRREGPLLLPRTSFIRSRSLEKSHLEEIPEEDRRHSSNDEMTSESHSDKIWAQLVAKYAEESPFQKFAEEFPEDSTGEKNADEKRLKEDERCVGISTHAFPSMKTSSDTSTEFTDENMMSENFSAQVGQRLNMYLARLEESKDDSQVEEENPSEEAREVEYDSFDIEMEDGSEDKILIMIEDDDSSGDRNEFKNSQSNEKGEDKLGLIVEKSTHLPHFFDSAKPSDSDLDFSKSFEKELSVEVSAEKEESPRFQVISEYHQSHSHLGDEESKDLQEVPFPRDSETLASIELETIKDTDSIDENEKLSKQTQLENIGPKREAKDIDVEANTYCQPKLLNDEELESFKDKQESMSETSSKLDDRGIGDESLSKFLSGKNEASGDELENFTKGINEETEGVLLSQKQEEKTVIKDSPEKEAYIGATADEDFAQIPKNFDNDPAATEIKDNIINQTLEVLSKCEGEVKADMSKANEMKVQEDVPIESTKANISKNNESKIEEGVPIELSDLKEDVPIFNIKLRRKSNPVISSEEHVVEELPEVSFSLPLRRKSKGEESLRKKALENLRRKNSNENGQISFEMREHLISEKSENDLEERKHFETTAVDSEDETTQTIVERELAVRDDNLSDEKEEKDEVKQSKDQEGKETKEVSVPVMDLLKRRTSRDLWKMECDKLLEVQNKEEIAESEETDVFNTRYEEFPEDYVSSETYTPIDPAYSSTDRSKRGFESEEHLDELLKMEKRSENENLKDDQDGSLKPSNKNQIDLNESLNSKVIPHPQMKDNTMETNEETQFDDSEKDRYEVDPATTVDSDQLILKPDEIATVKNNLTLSEEDLVSRILSQKSNEDYEDGTSAEAICKISQSETLKIDDKSNILKENIVKEELVFENKDKTVDISQSEGIKEREDALESHSTETDHSEKEHLLHLIRKERDGEKRPLSEEEIPDYLDEFKDLLVPRARRKKAKKRLSALTDIVKLDEPRLSSQILKFPDKEAASVRDDFYDPMSAEAGGEIAVLMKDEFLAEEEEDSREFQAKKEEQSTYKEAQRKELEKYLSMPDALTVEEQQELEELIAREESDKAIVAASEARLDALLSEVRKRLNTSEMDDLKEDENLEHFLNLPVGLSKEEENLLTSAEEEDNEFKDFETEDEYREFIRQRYLDELEEDRLRVEDEELDFAGSYDEGDDYYGYDYREEDVDLDHFVPTKDMEAEVKEESTSGFEDKAVGSDDLFENLTKYEEESKTKEPRSFFSLSNLKLTRKSTPRDSRESIGRAPSQDSSNEESFGDEFTHTSKKFFRYGSPGVKRKKKSNSDGDSSSSDMILESRESPVPVNDVEFEQEKSMIREFKKGICYNDDVSDDDLYLKRDALREILAEECENTEDHLHTTKVYPNVLYNASMEKEEGVTAFESDPNFPRVCTNEVLQDLSNGQNRAIFATNPTIVPTTKIPPSPDHKGDFDNWSKDVLDEDRALSHRGGDENIKEEVTSGSPVVNREAEDIILSRVYNQEKENDQNSAKTTIPSSDIHLRSSEGLFREQSVEVLEGENAPPLVDEQQTNVRPEVSNLEETIMSGRRGFGRSSVTSTPAVNGGGLKSESANGDAWPEHDKNSKSAALDEFEKMEKEVILEMEKNNESDKKDKKKKKKKKKSDVEKENQKTTQQSKEGLLEKHVGPRIRSFDPAKMKNKFSKPKEPTHVSTDCRICGKQVFQMEKIVAEKASWHKNCFRCKECNKNLTLETYQSNEGTLYCKPHFKELFRPKAVVTNEDEERKDRLMRRPRMIILESQPEALPDDVVRATDKPDYGLEELQQTLNVKQRFSMFENLAKETEKPTAEPISVRRSRSLMSKAARFLDGHDDKGDVDADYDDDDEEMSEEDYEEEEYEEGDEHESTNSIVRSKKKKERPMSFSGMGDLKAVWEQKQRREEMSQARKEEISKFRQMLCAGKNSILKERFESGIFDEDEEEGEGKRRNSKEEIKIEGKRVASNLMKKFEKGEPFILEDDEEDEEGEENGVARKGEQPGPEKKEVEEIFKEAETAKKARNVFKQIDQHVAQEGGPLLRSHSFASTINQEHRRSIDSSVVGHQSTRPLPEDVEVIKSGEKDEDFQVDTTDLASRFRFFLDYEKNKEKEREEERKVFRITPPREGIDQGMQGTEDLEVLGRDPNLIKCTDNYQDEVDCRNTKNILQMFKKMEMGNDDEEEEEGPRPLKRFTPPPDGREYDDDSEYSDEEYSEDEEDDEEEDENHHPEVRDELLQMSARKAASLRAKFERWEAEVERKNDLNKEPEECMPSLDTAKNLRAMFEHKASEVVKPIASKPITQKINRFVGGGDKCVACNKCVYAMEKLEVHGKILHKSCFRCHKCSTKLSMGSFSFGGGNVMYCTTHYKQLFTQKGSYDAFLEEKGKWTKKIEAINDPSTKSQD